MKRLFFAAFFVTRGSRLVFAALGNMFVNLSGKTGGITAAAFFPGIGRFPARIRNRAGVQIGVNLLQAERYTLPQGSAGVFNERFGFAFGFNPALSGLMLFAHDLLLRMQMAVLLAFDGGTQAVLRMQQPSGDGGADEQTDGDSDSGRSHPLWKERFENLVRANAEKAAAMGIVLGK